MDFPSELIPSNALWTDASVIWRPARTSGAAAVSQQFLRAGRRPGGSLPPLVLFEAKATLTKIYGVDPGVATQKLTQFATVPVVLLELDAAVALSAVQLAVHAHGLDLHWDVPSSCHAEHGLVFMATEDQKFAQVCTQFGVTPQSPFDAALRQQVAPGKRPIWLPRVCHESWPGCTW